MNTECPNCGLENAYFEVMDMKGAHYVCPDCEFEWVDESITAEEDDDEEDFEDEENDIFSIARGYTYDAIGDFVIEIIKNFNSYRISEKSLVVLAKIYMLIKKPKKYSVNGYLYILVKELYSEGSHQFQEIKIDGDGLELSRGGYVNGEYGGDSFSEIIYPVYDEDEAINIMTPVESFIDDLKSRLADPEVEVEIYNSGDEIDEI